MSCTYYARVAAVGRKGDMRCLCRAMLENAGWDEPIPEKLDGLTDAVRRLAAEEGGPECGFLYEMVTRRAYGDAEENASRFTVREMSHDLWVALFVYESQTPFQAEDWMRLHLQCDMLPMFMLRASDDYDRDKGMLMFWGGRPQEDWSDMEACWLWLATRYGDDDPDGAVRKLKRLARQLEEDELDDLTVPKLLDRCAQLVEQVDVRFRDKKWHGTLLGMSIMDHDYRSLFDLCSLLAKAALWDAENAPRWLERIEALRQAF